VARVGSGKQRVGGVLLSILGAVGKKPRDPEDVMRLGKLMHQWAEIVGEQFGKQTAPTKVSGGTLFVECSTNQWMQTLMFARDALLEKIRASVPEAGIKRIEMRLARERHTTWDAPRPIRPAWPDWRQQTGRADLPHNPLTAQIDETRAKMKAREEGLRREGAALCPGCRAVVVKQEGQLCAVCRYQHSFERERILRRLVQDNVTIPDAEAARLVPGATVFEVRKVRTELRTTRLRQLLVDNPWFNNDELRKLVSQATADECDQMRREVRQQGELEIESLLKSLDADEPDEEVCAAARAEICRAMMLHYGVTPDRLDMSSAVWYEKLPRAWRVVFTPPARSSRRNRLTTAVEE